MRHSSCLLLLLRFLCCFSPSMSMTNTVNTSPPPIVYTIAGSDSGGGVCQEIVIFRLVFFMVLSHVYTMLKHILGWDSSRSSCDSGGGRTWMLGYYVPDRSEFIRSHGCSHPAFFISQGATWCSCKYPKLPLLAFPFLIPHLLIHHLFLLKIHWFSVDRLASTWDQDWNVGNQRNCEYSWRRTQRNQE